MIYNPFKIGDLVKHTPLLKKDNRGHGVVVDILAVDYEKIDTIQCLWYDGDTSWTSKKQIKLIARGQDGERS
ncbi:MAG: hypothetical protein ACXADH_16215 [Candidatus Kariarchaeaceae archaeon]|jgi:hypothetical protein